MAMESVNSNDRPSPIQTCLVCGMSRSGTTLLVTMLDSHHEVSMGYEMLPAGIHDLKGAIKMLEDSLRGGTKNAKEIEQSLKDLDASELGRYVRQADRAAIEPQVLPTIIRDVDEYLVDRSELSIRYALSVGVVERKRQNEQARIRGFKLNAPSIELFDTFDTNTKYLFVIRDPRDIYSSHKANNFGRDVKHVCRAWSQYLKRFQDFAKTAPERTMLVRYEDVVRRIDENVASIGAFLNLKDPSPMRQFFDSKASVHEAGHTNAKALKQDVFDTSVGRWSLDLGSSEVQQIEALCGAEMQLHGYIPVALNSVNKLSTFWKSKRKKSIC